MNNGEAKKVLFCLTTANQWHYIKQAIEILKSSYSNFFEYSCG